MSEINQQKPIAKHIDRLQADGFVQIIVLADKYGYAKDHISRLARTGRVQGVRCGLKNEWFVKEASLLSYIQSDQSRLALPPKLSDQLSSTSSSHSSQTTPSVLSDSSFSQSNEGSLSVGTTNDRMSLKGVNAIVLPAILIAALGGVLIFGQATMELSRFANVQQAGLLETIKRFFAVPDISIYLTTDRYNRLLTRVRELEEQVGGNAAFGQAGSAGTQPTETLVREVVRTDTRIVQQPAPAGADLATLYSRLDSAETELDTLRLKLANVDTAMANMANVQPAIPVVPWRGDGTPQFALGSDSVTTRVLTVTENAEIANLTIVGGTASLDSLSVAGNADIGGNASITGDLLIQGNIGIGTLSAPMELTVVGSGSFSGRLDLTRSPTESHTGTWPGFANVSDATIYLNPSSPVADGSIIAYANGNAPKFVVDAEGDVFAAGNLTLVGTTTQASTDVTGDLSVEGNARFGDSAADRIYVVGTVLPKTLVSNIFTIQASPSWAGDSYFRILDAVSNPVFTVASSGNVGIGTSSPGQRLHVSGGHLLLDNNQEIRWNDAGGTERTALELDSSNNFHVGTSAGGNLIFHNGASYTERMRIDANGNVGIGISSPASTFTVLGGTAQGAQILITSTGADATLKDGRLGVQHYTNAEAPLALIAGRTDLTSNRVIIGGGRAEENTATAVEVYTAANTTTTTGTQRMIIDGSGNVGIGTTGPMARLHVQESTAGLRFSEVGANVAQLRFSDAMNSLIHVNYSAFTHRFITSGVERLRVTDTGNVGIGTTIPTGLLHLQKLGGDSLQISDVYSTNGGHAPTMQFRSSKQNTVGFTTTSNGDWLGNMEWYGVTSANSAFGLAARMIVVQDGSSGTTNVPSRIEFRTSDGTGSPVERLVIKGSGNVGIGTTNPGNNLEIAPTLSGGINIRPQTAPSTAAANQAINFVHQNGTNLGFIRMGYDTDTTDNTQYTHLSLWATQANSALRFGTNNSEAMRIANTGNVGIGTTGPATQLHLLGNAPTLRLQDNQGVNGVFDIALGNTDVDIGMTTTLNEDLHLLTDNTRRLTIDGPTGNVGIGTTTPGLKLDVNGSIGVTGGWAYFTQSAQAIRTYSGGVYTWVNSGSAYSGTVDTGLSRGAAGKIYVGNGTAANASGTLVAANIGIGTTNPLATLDISGLANSNLIIARTATNKLVEIGGDATPDGLIRVYNSSDSAVVDIRADANPTYFNGGGNVGIGTSNPGYKLEVIGGARVSGAVRMENDQRITWGSAAGEGITGNQANNSLTIRTNSTDRVTINASGNVGIGTTTPEEKLEVNGSIQLSNSNTFIGDGNNNFGVVKFGNLDITIMPSYQSASRLQITAQGGLFQGGVGGTAATLRLNRNDGASTDFPIFTADYGGSEKFRINGSGNVGIGTTSPTDKVNVSATAAGANVSLRVTNTATNDISAYSSLKLGQRHDIFTYATEIRSVRYGTWDNTAGTHSAGLAFEVVSATVQSEAMRIDNTGNVGIGSTSPNQKLDVNGTIRQTGGVNCDLAANASGDVGCTSDERLKDIHGAYLGGLGVINAINPISFNYIGEDYTHIGFSAQNVATVLSEAAPLQPSGYYGLDSNAVLAATVNAIKELDLKVEDLASASLSGEFGSIGEPVGIAAIKNALVGWLSDAANGIVEVVAGTFRAKEQLCINDTCVTEDQLRTLLLDAGMSPTSGPSASTDGDDGDVAEDDGSSDAGEAEDNQGDVSAGGTDESSEGDEDGEGDSLEADAVVGENGDLEATPEPTPSPSVTVEPTPDLTGTPDGE